MSNSWKNCKGLNAQNHDSKPTRTCSLYSALSDIVVDAPLPQLNLGTALVASHVVWAYILCPALASLVAMWLLHVCLTITPLLGRHVALPQGIGGFLEVPMNCSTCYVIGRHFSIGERLRPSRKGLRPFQDLRASSAGSTMSRPNDLARGAIRTRRTCVSSKSSATLLGRILTS